MIETREKRKAVTIPKFLNLILKASKNEDKVQLYKELLNIDRRRLDEIKNYLARTIRHLHWIYVQMNQFQKKTTNEKEKEQLIGKVKEW
jgi:hypothetical protein